VFCSAREGLEQCIAVCCSVLQRVAMCCSVLQCNVTNESSQCFGSVREGLEQCVAVC